MPYKFDLVLLLVLGLRYQFLPFSTPATPPKGGKDKGRLIAEIGHGNENWISLRGSRKHMAQDEEENEWQGLATLPCSFPVTTRPLSSCLP